MDASNRKSSDEIDLLYFFNPLFRGVSRVANGLVNYFQLLSRHLLQFLVIVMVVVLCGYALRFFVPRYYKSNAMLISHGLPASFCATLIDNLQRLAEDPSNAGLVAQQLRISPAVAASIVSISTAPVDSVIYLSERDSTASMFRVDVILRNTAGLKEIQNGLQYFLENNEFALKRKEARRKRLELLRQDLISKSRSLDSLKEIVNNSISPRSSGQGIVFGEPVSPIEVYELQGDYYRQLLEVEEDLSLIENIEVLQPFLPLNAPNYPDVRRWLLYSILLGLIAAMLLTPTVARSRK